MIPTLQKIYDVIVVGAGPSGIFTVLELLKNDPTLRILLIEKGSDIDTRKCPMMIKDVSCRQCHPCAILSGWGGAGAYSDGKLSLSGAVGGNLGKFIGEKYLTELIQYVDSIYQEYGAPHKVYGTPSRELAKLKKEASKHDLTLIPSPIRHIGTENCRVLLERIRRYVDEKIDISFRERVTDIVKNNNDNTFVVKTSSNRELKARFLILAPGREGARWLERLGRRLNLTLLNNPVDIGVRVELPAHILEPLTSVTYEPKLIYYSRAFDDMVRTFCVNPYGEVVKEYLKGVWTVNGHSYSDRKTENTNFAILVSTFFTDPFDEPIAYGRYIARLANFLGQGVLVQRLGDLRAGRRSTPERIAKGLVKPTLTDATAGDLSFALPYRYLKNILEMLEAMDGLAPGVNSRQTLLYGIEVKFYSRQIMLTEELETEAKNLFAIGDGAGVSRGLIQASASGVVAARAILKRF